MKTAIPSCFKIINFSLFFILISLVHSLAFLLPYCNMQIYFFSILTCHKLREALPLQMWDCSDVKVLKSSIWLFQGRKSKAMSKIKNKVIFPYFNIKHFHSFHAAKIFSNFLWISSLTPGFFRGILISIYIGFSNIFLLLISFSKQSSHRSYVWFQVLGNVLRLSLGHSIRSIFLYIFFNHFY